MSQVKLLGDPHLGRRFRTGVPLHRLGERETMVGEQFLAELRVPPGTELHVNMGDLFDKFIVPVEIVIWAADRYIEAAAAAPNTTFVVLRGNHDVSRDTERKSSFDLFTRLVANVPNIKVVGDTPLRIGTRGFVGYHPFTPTIELVAGLGAGLEEVYGHWDVVDFGGDNVIPTSTMRDQGIQRAITGHDHVARTFNQHGVHVTVTGSMQPYTHAEDPEGWLYRTLSLAELKELSAEELEHLNVRLKLTEHESIPDDLNCLSITAVRIQSEVEEVVTSEQLEGLDLFSMAGKVLEGLSIRDALLIRLKEQVD